MIDNLLSDTRNYRSRMSLLCIQIQPRRARGVNFGFIRDVAAQLGPTELLTHFYVDEGVDDGPYMNLCFDTPALAEAWPIIYSRLFEDPQFGASLKKASIVTCQGQKGWDDYLLLHHFDQTLTLDRL
jgi:hypothetical protein